MTVGELLANYEGTVAFYDSTTQKEVGNTFGGSPLISQLQSFEVLGWSAVKSTAHPKIVVVCQFTQPTTPPEENETTEEVETTEGE